MDSIVDIDSWLLLTVNGWHNDYIDPMMLMFSGRSIWIPLYVAIAGVICWRYGWRQALILIVATGIVVGAADFVCASFIRPLVQRMRPTNPDNPVSTLVHIVNGYRSGSYGFPSCHAANTVALAVFTSLIIRMRWYTIFIALWAAMQCYSRMYLGVHYPGDLIVGAIIGAVLASCMYWFVDRIIDIRYTYNAKANSKPVIITGVAICMFIVVYSLVA